MVYLLFKVLIRMQLFLSSSSLYLHPHCLFILSHPDYLTERVRVYHQKTEWCRIFSRINYLLKEHFLESWNWSILMSRSNTQSYFRTLESRLYKKRFLRRWFHNATPTVSRICLSSGVNTNTDEPHANEALMIMHKHNLPYSWGRKYHRAWKN